ncbi:MAG: aminoacyl-tRNA hydrolase [Bacilli bacterium]
MYLIVGLGNPGSEYSNTRHNMGFRFIDAYAKKHQIQITKKKFDGLYSEFTYNGEKVILLKPQLYMNLSGKVVVQFIDYFKIDLQNLLVISDDLDLPFGSFRLKKTGSSGGHNGLKDIEVSVGTKDYKRLKLGISNNSSMDTKDYVLGKFTNQDILVLEGLEGQIINILDDFLEIPFEKLMSKYNQK